jgi:thiamine biosynthesis lipoprotein
MGVQTLECNAMGTVFIVAVAHMREAYARQAVAAAFEELQRLEALLSTYVENSDVSRVNAATANVPEIVNAETFDCLQLALSLEKRTGGAFNIAYGSRQPTAGPRAIRLMRRPCPVIVRSAGVRIDLGGIGKGFALDRMAAVFRQWEVTSALCWCKESTYLALDASPRGRGWRMRFGPAEGKVELSLEHRAVSGSGSQSKGRHIVDPADGHAVDSRRATWATARTAAEADALSTALMVMSHGDIRTMLSREPGVGAYVTTDDGQKWAVKRATEKKD